MKHFVLVIVVLTQFGCGNGLSDESIVEQVTVKTKRVEGYYGVDDMLTSIPLTSSWYATYPKIAGIPDSLESVLELHTHVNYDQVAYQGFKSGRMKKTFIEGLIGKWGIDTTTTSSEPIHSYILGISGEANGRQYYMIDTNGNQDVSDEKIYEAKNTDSSVLHASSSHAVLIDRFINRARGRDTLQIRVVGATGDPNITRLHIQNNEYRVVSSKVFPFAKLIIIDRLSV